LDSTRPTKERLMLAAIHHYQAAPYCGYRQHFYRRQFSEYNLLSTMMSEFLNLPPLEAGLKWQVLIKHVAFATSLQ